MFSIKPFEEVCFSDRKWLALPDVVTLDSFLWELSIPGHDGSYRELNGLNQRVEGRSPPVFARVSATSYGEKRDPVGLILRQSTIISSVSNPSYTAKCPSGHSTRPCSSQTSGRIMSFFTSVNTVV